MEKTSIRDIASIADVNVNTLYYYFRTKAEIVICCLEYGLKRVTKRLFDLAMSGSLSDEAFLLQILDRSLEGKEDLCWCYQVITSPNYNWLARDIVIDVRKGYARHISSLAKRNGCKDESFKVLLNISILIIKDYMIIEDKKSIEQFKVICDQISNLVRK